MRVAEEREDKFEVDADWVMPQVTRLAPKGGRIDEEVRRLQSIYFDTPGEGLRLFGVTLRRCIGGSGMGWQLKVPSDNAPIELQSGTPTTKVRLRWHEAWRVCSPARASTRLRAS